MSPIVLAFAKHVMPYHGKEFADDDSFFNGVVSAMIMRYDTSPDDPYIASFLSYRPSDPGLVKVWDDLIGTPSEKGIHRFHGALKQHKRLEEVFHYQSLVTIVNELESGSLSPSPASRSAGTG